MGYEKIHKDNGNAACDPAACWDKTYNVEEIAEGTCM